MCCAVAMRIYNFLLLVTLALSVTAWQTVRYDGHQIWNIKVNLTVVAEY